MAPDFAVAELEDELVFNDWLRAIVSGVEPLNSPLMIACSR